MNMAKSLYGASGIGYGPNPSKITNEVNLDQSRARVKDKASYDFWTAHAAYWSERGNHAKAEECRANALNPA